MCVLLTSVTVFFPGSLRLSVPPAVWGNWRLSIRQLEGWDTDEGEPSSGGDKREKDVHPKPENHDHMKEGKPWLDMGPAQGQRSDKERKEVVKEKWSGEIRRRR